MIRKPKKIIFVKKDEAQAFPLEDGSWITMKAPYDGWIIDIGKGVYSGIFVTEEELNASIATSSDTL